MTAFEQWWANHFGVEWYQHYEIENKNCKEAWNAAIDAAISKCQQVKEKHWRTSAQKPDSSCECKQQIQKLKSE